MCSSHVAFATHGSPYRVLIPDNIFQVVWPLVAQGLGTSPGYFLGFLTLYLLLLFLVLVLALTFPGSYLLFSLQYSARIIPCMSRGGELDVAFTPTCPMTGSLILEAARAFSSLGVRAKRHQTS